MGLKFKWFRAQLRLESPKAKRKQVEGIGFRITQHPEGYQTYKSTSEFSSAPNINVQNNTPSYMSKIEQPKSVNKPIPKLVLPPIRKPQNENTTEIRNNHQNIKSELAIKPEPVKSCLKPFQEEPDIIKVQPDKVSPPLIKTQLQPPPAKEEETDRTDWKIKIVDQKPKKVLPTKPSLISTPTHDTRNEDYYPVDESMYSMQAASIFFGGFTQVTRTRNTSFSDDESTAA